MTAAPVAAASTSSAACSAAWAVAVAAAVTATAATRAVAAATNCLPHRSAVTPGGDARRLAGLPGEAFVFSGAAAGIQSTPGLRPADHAPGERHADRRRPRPLPEAPGPAGAGRRLGQRRPAAGRRGRGGDRKSTRLNSSHANISYAV